MHHIDFLVLKHSVLGDLTSTTALEGTLSLLLLQLLLLYVDAEGERKVDTTEEVQVVVAYSQTQNCKEIFIFKRILIILHEYLFSFLLFFRS